MVPLDFHHLQRVFSIDVYSALVDNIEYGVHSVFKDCLLTLVPMLYNVTFLYNYIVI